LVEAAAALRAKSTPAVMVRAALLVSSLTGGEVSDYRAVPALIDRPVAKPRALLADKGYDGDVVREDPLWRGILPIIPPKANRRVPPTCDLRRYRDRNHVERLFNRLKQSRRTANRYDKTVASFLGFLSLAAAKLWLSDYVNRAYEHPCGLASCRARRRFSASPPCSRCPRRIAARAPTRGSVRAGSACNRRAAALPYSPS